MTALTINSGVRAKRTSAIGWRFTSMAGLACGSPGVVIFSISPRPWRHFASLRGAGPISTETAASCKALFPTSQRRARPEMKRRSRLVRRSWAGWWPREWPLTARGRARLLSTREPPGRSVAPEIRGQMSAVPEAPAPPQQRQFGNRIAKGDYFAFRQITSSLLRRSISASILPLSA